MGCGVGVFVTTRYESPLKFPDEHMRLLGIIAAHWESFEVALDRVAANAMSHEYGRVGLLLSNISFANKIDLLTVYARDAFVISHQDDALWREYNAIIDRIRKAYAGRNEYVHSIWHRAGDDKQLTRETMRTKGGKLNLVREPPDLAEMAAVAQEIIEAGNAFVAFFLRLGIVPEQQR